MIYFISLFGICLVFFITAIVLATINEDRDGDGEGMGCLTIFFAILGCIFLIMSIASPISRFSSVGKYGDYRGMIHSLEMQKEAFENIGVKIERNTTNSQINIELFDAPNANIAMEEVSLMREYIAWVKEYNQAICRYRAQEEEYPFLFHMFRKDVPDDLQPITIMRKNSNK